MTAEQRYHLWCEKVTDPELSAQLKAIADDPEEIRQRFYGDLEFGTGGLRGVIEAGSARMNLYTVGMATQGFADYLVKTYPSPSVAISFDSRIKSDVFARHTASVFAANGIRVYLMDQLRPTPVLSFAVRHFGCCGGVMVTASHNPSKYNGYKAYGPDGCQLSVEDSEAVIECVSRVDLFRDVKTVDFDRALAEGKIVMVGDELLQTYLDVIQKAALHPGICADSGLKLVYTPLNGTGKVPVTQIFERIGLKDVVLVPSQSEPDGTFPTCPFPNPEIREALEEGLKLCRKTGADLLIATDPDADRVGIAVRQSDGDYRLLTGNEVGCLMFDYVFSQRLRQGTMPEHPVAVKTIVTTPMADAIGASYGVEIRNVFTGFKYIGAVATELEKAGQLDRYLMGFEESYGYCVGAHVRDKDAVIASMFLCEMAAYYKKNGSSLLNQLNGLYKKFGHYAIHQQSFVFEGVDGMTTMAAIMTGLRRNPPRTLNGQTVVTVTDYEARSSRDTASGKTTATGLPQSDVLAYDLEDGSKVVVRPSGTEPKLKLYYTVKKATAAASENEMKSFISCCSELIHRLAKKN